MNKLDKASAALDAYLARPFVMPEKHRAEIARSAGRHGADPIALAAAVEEAVDRHLRSRAFLSVLPASERRKCPVPEVPEILDIVLERRELMNSIARLAGDLAEVLGTLDASDEHFHWSFAIGLAAVRHQPLPPLSTANADTAKPEPLADSGASALSDALKTISALAFTARALAPQPFELKHSHALSDIVVGINEAIETTLPNGSEALNKHHRSPAAPKGLLVALVAIALDAMTETGFGPVDQKHPDRLVRRVLELHQAQLEAIGAA